MGMASITIVSSLVFVVLLWIVVGVRHLKNSKRTLNSAWEFVDEKIRKRHDYAPVLIECLRLHSNDSVLEKLIEKIVPLRDSARRIYMPSIEKSEKENGFNGILMELLSHGEKTEALKDTYFLEIKKEINDINADISGRVDSYNEALLRYNKILENILLKPFILVLKMSKAEVFNV